MGNLCLDSGATASGSVFAGVTDGTPNNTRDNDTGTKYGAHGSGAGGNEGSIGYIVSVTFSGTGAFINTVNFVGVSTGFAGPGGGAFATWSGYLFYSGVWNHLISATAFSGSTQVVGSWHNVLAIGVTGSGNWVSGASGYPAGATGFMSEIRATGIVYAVPTVLTVTATNIEKTSALFYGSLVDTFSSPCLTRGFNYGTDTSYGQTLIENGTFIPELYSLLNTALQPGIPYYFRAVAVNTAGTGYGSNIQFITVGNDDEATKRMSRLVYDDMMDYMMEEY